MFHRIYKLRHNGDHREGQLRFIKYLLTTIKQDKYNEDISEYIIYWLWSVSIREINWFNRPGLVVENTFIYLLTHLGLVLKLLCVAERSLFRPVLKTPSSLLMHDDILTFKWHRVTLLCKNFVFTQASQWTMGFRLGGGEGDQVEGEWGKDKPKHLTRVGTNIVDTASGFI